VQSTMSFQIKKLTSHCRFKMVELEFEQEKKENRPTDPIHNFHVGATQQLLFCLICVE
jgi:hypothetical protein